VQRLVEIFGRLWSSSRFGAGEVDDYAEPIVVEHTRRGLVAMSLVFLGLLIGSSLVYRELGLDRSYMYTAGALAVLCAHVTLSARALRDLRTLHVLGMTLLCVSGTAFVLLAHNTDSLGAVLFTSVALLFMVIPLVPWGLREASLVTALIYAVFATSSWTVSERFDAETLWALQAFMLAAGAVSLTLVARGTLVRKDDIESRYALERSRRDVERVSLQDPLTGAWNRRFLALEFPAFVERVRKAEGTLHFAVIDIDRFKALNDEFGHAVGDDALRWVAHAITLHLGEAGHLVRAGGDEFVILYDGDSPEEVLLASLETLHARAAAEGPARLPEIALSVGIAAVNAHGAVSLDDCYLAADGALYAAKRSPVCGTLRLESRTLPAAAPSDEVRP